MSTPIPFLEQFRRLLGDMPENYTLEEWQYLYREVIFSMGTRILERFRHDATAPNPFEHRHSEDRAVAGGQTGVTRGPPPPAPPPPPPVKGGPILSGRPPWEVGAAAAAALAGVVLGIPPPHQ
jgi:hypothetical protein